MEKCLPELLSLICESLGRKDLLSMVLTGYRGFLDPALDALWHDIPSLDPLIACLPEDLWRIERKPHPKNPNADYRTYHLRRPLRAADLQRYLDRYARRIRKLESGIPLVWEEKSTILSRDTLRAIQIITNFNPGVLSPLLQSFYWAPYPPDLQLHLGTGPSSTISEYIFLFLGDHVRNFAFPRLDNSDDQTYATILMNIADRFKDLEAISLQSPYDTPPTLDISPSDTFLSSSPWRCLQSLAVDSITLPTLLHIATMPLLMSLILHFQNHDTLRYVPGSTPSFAQPGYFRSVQDLSISCPELGTATRILQQFPSFNVVSTLHCVIREAASLDDIQTALDAIAAHCDPSSLKNFSLTIGTEKGYGSPVSSSLDIDISPLFSFKNLRTLELQVLLTPNIGYKESFSITSEAVSRMAISWPGMKYLDISSTRPNTSPNTPPIDHRDILRLLEGMRSLTHLGLQFNATEIEGHELSSSGPFGLRRLHVHDSPVLSTSNAVSFLKSNTPNLKTFGYLSTRQYSGWFQEGWERVRQEAGYNSIDHRLFYESTDEY